MISDYISRKLKMAIFEQLEDGSHYAEIPGIRGVWANAPTLSKCRAELQSVFESWLVLTLQSGEKIPGLSVEHGADTSRAIVI